MNKTEIHLKQVEEAMTLLDVGEVEQVIEVLKIVRRAEGTVYLCGNGGSHATASHFANDLLKQARIKAICVGDLTPIVTAYGNDDGWANMFSHLIHRMLVPGDCVFGISCSGSSANVVNALEIAKTGPGFAVGMTGISNDSLINKLAKDGLIHARVPDIRVQEDLHMMACHAIVRQLQEGD